MDLNTEENQNHETKEDSVVDAFEQANTQGTEGEGQTDNTEGEVSEDVIRGEGETNETDVTDTREDLDWSQVPSGYQAQFESLQAHNKKLENDVRASNGRLHSALKTAKKAQEKANAKTLSFDDLESDDFNEVAQEFPEIKGALTAGFEKVAEHAAQQNAPVNAFLSELEQQTAANEQAYVETQLAQLSQKHPNYLQINATPEFARWLDDQDAATRASHSSDNAADLIGLFDKYERHQADTSKRNRLEQHAELPRKGAGVAGEELTDPVAIFNQITS